MTDLKQVRSHSVYYRDKEAVSGWTVDSERQFGGGKPELHFPKPELLTNVKRMQFWVWELHARRSNYPGLVNVEETRVVKLLQPV